MGSLLADGELYSNRRPTTPQVARDDQIGGAVIVDPAYATRRPYP